MAYTLTYKYMYKHTHMGIHTQRIRWWNKHPGEQT